MANLSQTFKVAGITTHGDSTKVRFADDLVRRIKQFAKGGATRVDLIELPQSMTKIEALEYLLKHAEFQSPSDQATIQDSLTDKRPKAARVPKSPKVPKVSVAKPSLDAIKARARKEVTAADVVAVVTEATDTK